VDTPPSCKLNKEQWQVQALDLFGVSQSSRKIAVHKPGQLLKPVAECLEAVTSWTALHESVQGRDDTFKTYGGKSKCSDAAYLAKGTCSPDSILPLQSFSAPVPIAAW
jgi:hypothetical protein